MLIKLAAEQTLSVSVVEENSGSTQVRRVGSLMFFAISSAICCAHASELSKGKFDR